MLFIVGGASTSVSLFCRDNTWERVTFDLLCIRFGGGLGAGLSSSVVRARGCNAREAMESMAGSGAFISGSLGPVAAGASHSTEMWGVYGGGIGLGFGLQIAAGGEYCWIR
jgi:hypothetical protein